MLAPSSSLTEIYDHFASLKSNQAGVQTSKPIEEIQAKLENAQTLHEKFPLYLMIFESRLVDFLSIRLAMCNTYKVLQVVEKTPNSLFSLYKMEIELVLEQFSAAFYMQINSEIGDNTKSLTDVSGVYAMLTQDLKELRMEIQNHCVERNAHSSFTMPKKRQQDIHLKLDRVSTNQAC